ncbi:MAG: hypothetical protein KBS54_02265 [Synergistaceae bacterium]|nr:hypothetical protein [Candidatus Equadaptatus faecalis]
MKKLTVFILAALIAITCVSTALAANWVETGRNDNSIFSVDISSVRRTDDTFRMWKKCVLCTPQAQAEWKKILESSKTPVYYVEYSEYKIDEPASRSISTTYYAEDGTVVHSFGEYYEWKMFPPDSVGEDMWHCGRQVLGLE